MYSVFTLLAVMLFSMTLYLIGCGGRPTSADKKGDQSFQVTDLSGRNIEFSGTAKKIVAIGPGALRFVCYVNGADKVIGIEHFEKASPLGRPYYMANSSLFSKLTVIGQGGPGTQADAEKLVKIKPDVIFTCLTDKAQSDELQSKTGIPVVVLDYGVASTFSQEVYDSIKLVGKIIGEGKRAQVVIDYMEECKKDLSDRTKNIPENEKPSVYLGGLCMYGCHGIDSTSAKYPPFVAINAKNVVDETGQSGSVTIDREKIIIWDPEIIFIDSGGYQLVLDDFKKNPEFYKSLSAVKNGHVYGLLSYNWYWTNVETAVADAYYAGKVIYPDKFKDIDPVKKANEIYKFMVGKELYDAVAKADSLGFTKITLE
jgi:iron complex transport system substrate-binding protein